MKREHGDFVECLNPECRTIWFDDYTPERARCPKCNNDAALVIIHRG